MRKLFFTLTLALASAAIAQKNETSAPFIEVTGTATKDVAPDLIYVSVTLSDKSTENKKYSIESQEAILVSILNEIGVDSKKMVLTDLGSHVLLSKHKETGFKQTKVFTITLDNASQVSVLFKKLYEANIREADVSRLANSRIEEFNKEVRVEAIKAARDKAVYLLAALGKQLGEPVEITELSAESSNYYRGNARLARSYESKAEAPDFRDFTIKYSYQVRFAIK